MNIKISDKRKDKPLPIEYDDGDVYLAKSKDNENEVIAILDENSSGYIIIIENSEFYIVDVDDFKDEYIPIENITDRICIDIHIG